MSALTEALRKKYRNRGAALAALGLDASIIEEEGEKMVRPLTVQQSALYLQHVGRTRCEGSRQGVWALGL
jgi:hypothetical protein